MFIVAKRNYLVRRADSSFYQIKKDYIGEIPEDVAKSDLVQRAILGGNIAVPDSMRDKALYQADDVAEELAAGYDIRPDAEKAVEETSEDISEPVKTRTRKKE